MELIESADEFIRLRTSQVPEEYRRAAHEQAPAPVWLEVIERYPEMRQWVAHNKTVPIEVLEVLAADSDADVRAAVADKRKLTVELFAQLAGDSDEGVRARIAYNGKVPAEVLEILARDSSPFVREAVRGASRSRRSNP